MEKQDLTGRKPEIFDHFVRFYGKKYRDDIAESFKDLHIYEQWNLNNADTSSRKLGGRNYILPVAGLVFGSVRGYLKPNAVELKSGKLKYSPVVWLAQCDDYAARDYTLVHEMEHAAATKLLSVKNRKYFVCGVREFNIEKTPSGRYSFYDAAESGEIMNRKYRFDEAITEVLAQKNARKMHESGLFIRDSVDNFGERVKEANGYLGNKIGFAREFCAKNLDAVIESRLKKEPQILIDHVGKERFDAELRRYY
jgi:hypothetical protein